MVVPWRSSSLNLSSKNSYPGMIQCMHIPVGHTGIENDEFTLKSTQRYANNGYVVAVPFIFHWWPKSAGIELKREEFRDDWTILDLNAAYKLLSGLENVDAECIGILLAVAGSTFAG